MAKYGFDKFFRVSAADTPLDRPEISPSTQWKRFCVADADRKRIVFVIVVKVYCA